LVWEENIWNEFIKLKTRNESTAECIKALYDLNIKKKVGGESGCRLRVFHAMLLYIREPFLSFSEPIPASKLIEEEINKFYSKNGLEGRHHEGVPSYAVDRHNSRGKGGGSNEIYNYGTDTTDWIRTAAQENGIDISSWTPEEIAKSHGPGRRTFQKINCGTPTLISQFFDEGSWVNEEVIPGPFYPDPDPYRALAIQFYLYWEEKYGSLNARSAYIVPQQIKTISELKENLSINSLPPSSQNKNEKKKRGRVQNSGW